MLNDSSLISGQTTVLAMAESLECFNIPIPCHVLDKLENNNQQFGLRYNFDKDIPLKGEEKEVYNVRVKDSMLEEEFRKQLEGNNTALLDTMARTELIIQRNIYLITGPEHLRHSDREGQVCPAEDVVGGAHVLQFREQN